MNRFDQSEREHGRARQVAPPGSVEPRRGGSVPLPGQTGSGLLFNANVANLGNAADVAQPGWCVRMSMPELTNAALVGIERSILSLLAEVHISSGGVESVIEVDAFPGFSLHVASDIVSAKLKWQDGVSMVVPPSGVISWQLTRGQCPTTATRTFFISQADAPWIGEVPLFATHFALFSPSDLDPILATGFGAYELAFATSDAGALVHAYKGDALIGCIGDFTPIPRGARSWRWPYGLPPLVDPSEYALFHIVFAYGALVP